LLVRGCPLKALEPARTDQAVAKCGKVRFSKLGNRQIGNRICQNRLYSVTLVCDIAGFPSLQRFIFVTSQRSG
jgi:hypothetical protein